MYTFVLPVAISIISFILYSFFIKRTREKRRKVSEEAILHFIKDVFGNSIPHNLIKDVHHSTRTIRLTEVFEETLFYWLKRHPVYSKEF